MKRGDIIQLGRHRLMCGDSTHRDDWLRLMGDERAMLVHADPPYGMGKAIKNDNLRREKLLKFNLEWLTLAGDFATKNASFYVWGNAEELWRLWYQGDVGKKLGARMMNEIVWSKGYAAGSNTETGYRYSTASERCLFFARGSEWSGLNRTADDYWEGWEPLRRYFVEQFALLGMGSKERRAFFGSWQGHLTDAAQWHFPTRDRYAMLQSAAAGRAFLRSYDDLRAEYEELSLLHEAERVGDLNWFDNQHEIMWDVWTEKPVLSGRLHPTEKPLSVTGRIIKSSCPPGGLVVEPFGGSGTTLIAAESTSRVCYMMELDPKWCDVIVKRYENLRAAKPPAV